MESEDHGELLLGADGDQVIRQQLAGRQELVVAALVDEDVQLRPRVGGGQRGGVVRLGDAATLVLHRHRPYGTPPPRRSVTVVTRTPAAEHIQAARCCPRRRTAVLHLNQLRAMEGAGLLNGGGVLPPRWTCRCPGN